MSTLLQQLNPAQRAAVEATEGPVMVIAGAGSGKTRVLMYRIAYLMEKGVDPFNILALTFTNKAAREMKARIAGMMGNSASKGLWMGTFHSVFARILRAEGGALGFPSNFTIYDTEDAQKVIANLVKEKDLDKEIYKPKTLQNRISAYKNALVTPTAYAHRADLIEADKAARLPLLGAIYTEYTERCFRAGAMDFDDLLLKTNELLARFPEILAKYQDRFRYLMVDEYQDTNHSQYIIVKALASRFENLCVVGDDAQSIYSFRGANIRNILSFRQDYPEAQIFKLEQNYRSTDHIVRAANSLIEKNKDRLEKVVWTANDPGEKITVFKAVSDFEEGNYVAERISEAHFQHQWDYSRFAILYRTNAQSRSFEDALRKRNISYRIFGGLSFYMRKEVKDLLAYFRLSINPNDEEAFRRIINYPKREIGPTTLDRLNVFAQEKRLSLFEAAEEVVMYPSAGINGPTVQRLSNFCIMIRSFAAEIAKGQAYEAAQFMANASGLLRELKSDGTPEGVSRLENTMELLNAIQDFYQRQSQVEGGDASLGAFLQDVALITDADKEDDERTPKVSLMSIHQSKGLEFPCVFVVGLEETLFPNLMAINSREDLEEERRLFYVALTRAERKAYITYAHTRYRFGKLIDCEPSRFIEEIDEQHLDFKIPTVHPFTPPESLLPFSGNGWGKAPARFGNGTPTGRKFPPKETGSSPRTRPAQSPAPARPAGMKPLEALGNTPAGEPIETPEIGMRVIHPQFGRGQVVDLNGEGPNASATVLFDHTGEKKLLLRFAKLERETP